MIPAGSTCTESRKPSNHPALRPNCVPLAEAVGPNALLKSDRARRHLRPAVGSSEEASGIRLFSFVAESPPRSAKARMREERRR